MADRPFSVGFEERVHRVASAEYHRIGAPVVALCGTVFVPKTFDPPPELPECRRCAEAEVSLLWHVVFETTDKAEALQRRLDAPAVP